MPMNKELLKVALRQSAVYINHQVDASARENRQVANHTLALVFELRQMGFALSEDLLHAVDVMTKEEQDDLLDVLNEVMGTRLNWASLVRGWLEPTGETVWDHFLTMVANVMVNAGEQIPGTRLPCGHFIPEGTFPLERYNGCPFCGTPFRTADFVYRGQGEPKRVLQLWGDEQLEAYARHLLTSPVAPDATQRDSVKILMRERLDALRPCFGQIQMKETRMLVIDQLTELGHDDEAGRILSTPADVMRYLWYRHTGKLQILEPRTLLHVHDKNQRYERHTPDDVASEVKSRQEELKLRYDRPWGRRVARWLNDILQRGDQEQQLAMCLESMHPKREMWVRFIRALRLAEYARKKDFEPLRQLMDRFYRQDYDVWQGRVDQSMRRRDTDETLRLLRQRPGLFARCLFSAMLRLDKDSVLQAFREVLPQVAPRLILSLSSQVESYFDPQHQRVVRPLTGVLKQIGPNPSVSGKTAEEMETMKHDVRNLYFDAMRRHFAVPTDAHTIFIDPMLLHIPVPVGDRTSAVQDLQTALQGTRFPVEGDHVRLFLQWGQGLPKQHLDMDLSCYLLTDEAATQCAYFNLTVPGAQHSGDIQQIPDQVGAAEYIELTLSELEATGVRRVVFTCNAYTPGEISPNVMLGWMNAEAPMTVSDETGVAYDPSTVQHMVRIPDDNLSKGLIFGVLEVAQREIIWLEVPFDGQTVLSVNPETIGNYLRQLSQKPTIGQVLQIKAEAQHLRQVDSADEADEVYTMEWAHRAGELF